MEKNKKLMWTFNCIKCGKEITYYCVNEPNKQCPCIECILKEMKGE